MAAANLIERGAYVYGTVEAGTAKPRDRGIGGAPLGVVAGQDAAALVSEVASGHVRLGRDEVLLHSQVLERAFARGSVLPMRFGVVMSDAEEVRSRLLEEHGPELRAQLAEFAGKAEIRIRATYEEESLLREVVREYPQIASLREAVQGGSENATCRVGGGGGPDGRYLRPPFRTARAVFPQAALTGHSPSGGSSSPCSESVAGG